MVIASRLRTGQAAGGRRRLAPAPGQGRGGGDERALGHPAPCVGERGLEGGVLAREADFGETWILGSERHLHDGLAVEAARNASVTARLK